MEQVVRLDVAKAFIDKIGNVSELLTFKGAVDVVAKKKLRELKARGKETLEAQNEFAEIKIRIDRRMGELTKEMEGGQGARTDRATSSQAAKKLKSEQIADVGLSKDSVSRNERIASLPAEDFEAHIEKTKAAGKELTQASVLDVAKKKRRQEREVRIKERREAREQAHSQVSPSFVLHHCPISALGHHVEAESIDVILTDPPYAKEYLDCWGTLASFAAYALKPGGLLAAMGASTHLPAIIENFAIHRALTYRWTMALLNLNQTAQIFHHNIKSSVKLVLLYTKGEKHGMTWIRDGIIADPKTVSEVAAFKEDHLWGQGQGMVNELARRLCAPGDVVCDPFVGAGSNGIAALEVGCPFIGADVEERCILTTDEKLSQWEKNHVDE